MYELFCELATKSQKELKSYMSSVIDEYYDNGVEYVESEHFIFAIGDIDIMLVAHLDTVHKYMPDEIYFDEKKQVVWSPQGLGADDRAGVLAIIQILRSGRRPHILLTTDEEIGGIGASNFAKCIENYPQCKYIIELDRMGYDDCVFYDCDNPDFTKYITSFGFCVSEGIYSDIVEICPVWGVAGVNLSVGYYDEHTLAERLHFPSLTRTIELVKKMLDDEANASHFKFIWSEKSLARQLKFKYLLNQTKKQGIKKKCGSCGSMIDESDLIPVMDWDLSTNYFCIDCFPTFGDGYCECCGNFYSKVRANDDNLCPRCGGYYVW